MTGEVVCTDDEGGAETIEFITEWSGELLVIDIKRRQVVATRALPGQPDSVAISPNGKYAAITIENERNEDVGGGLIAQGRLTDTTDPCALVAYGEPEPGTLVIVEFKGKPDEWKTETVDLTHVEGMFAGRDPEPEYVDINQKDEAVVTLQENNHIVVVDLEKGRIKESFSAGAVDLVGVDATEEEIGPQENGLVLFAENLDGKRRRPDLAPRGALAAQCGSGLNLGYFADDEPDAATSPRVRFRPRSPTARRCGGAHAGGRCCPRTSAVRRARIDTRKARAAALGA